MTKLKCKECGEYMKTDGGTMSTCVGFFSPPGHNHDNNCKTRLYTCKCGAVQNISKINKCPNPECDWTGKTECFCHEGKKVEEWYE